MHSELVICTTLLVLSILPSITTEELTLSILHTNDVHARFLEIDKYGGNCGQDDIAARKCYGGFARLHHQVTELRRTHPNVVYLSGGDYFQGTLWYTLFKWRVIAHFVNQLNHTAMALGNHEFDDNIGGLVPFLEAVQFPVLSANIDDTSEPSMRGKYKKSVVVEYEGRKVGIIGYTTTETETLSFPGKLKFTDEIEAVKSEAALLASQGVNIILAVGHAGYDVDLKIAESVPLVDVVIGGHTNTFLYNGPHPDVDVPLASYPTVVTQSSGKQVPVIQAYAFGKYLGYLNVTFDEEGNVKRWSGNPILLDASVPQDEAMKLELVEWGKNISEEVKDVVARTRVLLEGRSRQCRLQECNLGNVITNAMVHMTQKYADDVEWNDVTMAILNSGGIRSSISETANNGSITYEDVLTVLPFQNTIDVIEIEGKYLRAAFEHSVKDYDPKGLHLPGKFLQVAGIRVEYDLSQPNGQRVRDVRVTCSKCRVPQFEPLNDAVTYKVAMPTYVAGGGDGYKVIHDNILVNHISGILDSDVLIEYLKETSPITQGLEGRIRFYNGTDCSDSNPKGEAGASAASPSALTAYTNYTFLSSILFTTMALHFTC